VADKPLWVETLLNNTSARDSFMEYVEKREADAVYSMRDSFKSDVDQARIFAGESECWKRLKNQILMYEREEEQNAFIQEQTGPTR